MSKTRLAKLIGRLAHKGQKRWNGDDYFEAHVMPVAAMVRKATHSNWDAVTVAYLHDVLEDTDVSYWDLVDAEFSQEVLLAVVAITRVEGETYATFIERVADNYLAAIVKRQDLKHNLLDSSETSSLTKRYEKAVVRLGG